MNHENTLKSASYTPEGITLQWLNGDRAEFPSLWLRDNCPCDRDSRNGQRLIDVSDLPHDPRIRAASPREETVLIEWENESHPASFDLQWLRNNAPGHSPEKPELAAKMWLEGSKLEAAKDFAWASLPEFRDLASVRLAWMTKLIQDGIAFLRGVPCTEHAVLEAVQPMGIVL